MSRSTAYDLQALDESFARAWDGAVDQGTDVLEDEAFRRAYEGVEEPLVAGDRQIVDVEGKPIVIRRDSDSLLMTLLKARRPERFCVRSTVEARVAVAQDLGPAIREVLATFSQAERDVVERSCERRVAIARWPFDCCAGLPACSERAQAATSEVIDTAPPAGPSSHGLDDGSRRTMS